MPKNDNTLLILFLAALVLVFAPDGCTLPVIGAKPPFKADKLTVLVVEESSADGTSVTPPWVNGTAAGTVRDYIAKRGGDFRLIDQNNASTLVDAKWQEALSVKRDGLPWLVAAGPKSGVSQKLPATAADTIKLLEGVK